MKKLEDLILTYKDFPKKGIDFKDVLEILQYPDIFHDLILKMSSSQFLKNAEAIISIDARGFIFAIGWTFIIDTRIKFFNYFYSPLLKVYS